MLSSKLRVVPLHDGLKQEPCRDVCRDCPRAVYGFARSGQVLFMTSFCSVECSVDLSDIMIERFYEEVE